MNDHVVEVLDERGAGGLPHPGGTLLDHLVRTGEILAGWTAPPDLVLAGICHAAYGTDGFPTPLFAIEERSALQELIGHAAERIVYLYGCCDRDSLWPQLGAGAPLRITDRLTGEVHETGATDTAALLELSVANELDIARHNPDFAATTWPALVAMFERASRHLSRPARESLRSAVG
jgi:hypothetical protein